MTYETYSRLLPAFKKTGLVYLQGWGEPFTNPDIFRMIAAAKASGPLVGTSTNGMLLDDDRIEELIKSGLDIIAFSLAGTSEKNDLFRAGTSIEKVLHTIHKINEVKAKCGIEKPRIHIAYMLLDSARKELDGLVPLLGRIKIDQVVISTLDMIPNNKLKEEAITPRDNIEYREMSRFLEDIVSKADELGVKVHYNLAHPERKQGICLERAGDSFFVSSDGSVSPCVFTNLPVADESVSAGDQQMSYRRLVFGSINDESVGRIWGSKSYRRFRQSFRSRRYEAVCRKCRKLYMG
jgi:MoaA/NifB/PqqE/SkfB family radical SAM enzyme